MLEHASLPFTTLLLPTTTTKRNPVSASTFMPREARHEAKGNATHTTHAASNISERCERNVLLGRCAADACESFKLQATAHEISDGQRMNERTNGRTATIERRRRERRDGRRHNFGSGTARARENSARKHVYASSMLRASTMARDHTLTHIHIHAIHHHSNCACRFRLASLSQPKTKCARASNLCEYLRPHRRKMRAHITATTTTTLSYWNFILIFAMRPPRVCGFGRNALMLL